MAKSKYSFIPEGKRVIVNCKEVGADNKSAGGIIMPTEQSKETIVTIRKIGPLVDETEINFKVGDRVLINTKGPSAGQLAVLPGYPVGSKEYDALVNVDDIMCTFEE